MSGNRATSGSAESAATTASARPTTYRRSTGTARGDARRQQLLTAVTDDVAAHGLVDFSLRRAARAAGATHKVLLYHFADADDLLACVVAELRARRIAAGVGGPAGDPGALTIDRIPEIWAVLTGAEETALVQAMGLAMYDPDRHAALVRGSAAEYLDALRSMCPAGWTATRRDEVAQLVLATTRGLLLARRTGADETELSAGLAALHRAVLAEIARNP